MVPLQPRATSKVGRGFHGLLHAAAGLDSTGLWHRSSCNGPHRRLPQPHAVKLLTAQFKALACGVVLMHPLLCYAGVSDGGDIVLLWSVDGVQRRHPLLCQVGPLARSLLATCCMSMMLTACWSVLLCICSVSIAAVALAFRRPIPTRTCAEVMLGCSVGVCCRG